MGGRHEDLFGGQVQDNGFTAAIRIRAAIEIRGVWGDGNDNGSHWMDGSAYGKQSRLFEGVGGVDVVIGWSRTGRRFATVDRRPERSLGQVEQFMSMNKDIMKKWKMARSGMRIGGVEVCKAGG